MRAARRVAAVAAARGRAPAAACATESAVRPPTATPPTVAGDRPTDAAPTPSRPAPTTATPTAPTTDGAGRAAGAVDDDGRRPRRAVDGDRRRAVPRARLRRPRRPVLRRRASRYDPATATHRRHGDDHDARRPSARRIALDAAELVVEAVTVDGAAATFEQTPTELLVHPGDAAPAGRAGRRRRRRTTTTSTTSTGRRSASARAGSRPTTARTCSTSPTAPARGCRATTTRRDKATWRFELTVPAGVTAVANGQLVEQRPAGDGDDVGVGAAGADGDVPRPAADRRLRGPRRRRRPATIPLTNVALRDDVERMQPYFDLTAEQIAFFEPLFGPYPLDRYGLAFADSVAGLAMETQGRSLFSRDDFRRRVDEPHRDVPVPRARPPVVRRRRHPGRVGGHLAQRVVRHVRRVAVARPRRAASTSTRPPPTCWPPASCPASRPATRRSPTTCSASSATTAARSSLHALRLELGDDAFFTLLQRWVAEQRRHVAHDGGLHRARRGGRRPRPRRRSSTTGCTPTRCRRRSPADPAASVPGEPVAEQPAPAPARRASAATPRRARPRRRRRRPAATRPTLTPSQRSGSGSHARRAVADPRQAREVGVAAGDQVGERAPGEVRRRHPVADVAAGHGEPVARSKRTAQRQSRGTPSGPPQWYGNVDVAERGEQLADRVDEQRSRTPSSVSKPGSIRDPKWYGAPRPPNAMRPSAVRWP